MVRLIRFLFLGSVLAAGSLQAQSNAVDGVLTGLAEQPLNPVLLRELKGLIPRTADPALRCRLAVLYTLGSLASGNREEGLAARAATMKAFPGNDLIQDLADERLSRPCTQCEGGRVLDPCTACGGSGRCTVCRGTGQQTVPGLGTEPRKVKCMHCVNAPGRCKACGGTRGDFKPCPTCAGTGLVLATDRANILYMRLLKALEPVVEKTPVIVVVTAAPPPVVEVDPAVTRAAEVKRAVAAAQAQAAASPLLRQHGLTAEEVRGLTRPDLTPAEREEALAALRKRGLAHPTRGRYFFLPFPEGLTFCVADVVKNPYGGYYLKLSSTPPLKNPPAVPLTPRETLEEAARAICEPMGGFLSDPTVCVPDGDLKTGLLRKGEVIRSGAWFVPVQVSDYGLFQKAGSCYRSEDELMAQLGFNR